MLRDHHVIHVREITPNCFVLRIERNDLKFEAGQLVSLGPRGLGVNREYSIYSGEQDPYLEFLIRKVNDGTVSIALSKVTPQSKVFVLGPYSDFKIKNTLKNDRPHWLIASGTGIAPYHSMIKSNPNLNYRLIHGVRFKDERYDLNDYDQHRFVACLSQESKETLPTNAFSGRVTDYIKQAELPKDCVYYICGNNRMITEVYDILKDRSVSPDNIHSEVFF